jgi:PelA/Pel-15E family pectate lyase
MKFCKIVITSLILLIVACVWQVFAAKNEEPTTKAKADLTVATDGTGDVKTVTEAIAKVPENNTKRFVILIKAGTYSEQIRIPANKPYISFIGEAADKTKLTFKIGNKDAGTTSGAYSIYIGGHDFQAENITFENSFGTGSQAVAVLVEADRVMFKNCRFLGWQDTLYAKNGRQYYKDCYIEGHVDFIFGQAAAVFENCEIHSKGDGYVSAPMRFAADEPSGFVFIRCKLTGENTKNGVFLGRPWRAYGRTVYLNTEMGSHIRPEGWNNWNNPANEKTAYFAEYNSSGEGAQPDVRVKWIHQLTKAESQQFETENFLKGKDGWNPKRADDEWLEKNKPDYSLVTWKEVLRQQPLWYATDEAARIADEVVLYQKENGGWEKNIDMAAMPTQKEKDELARKKSDISETTIDNGATYTQLRFLAKVNTASLTKPTPPNGFEKHKAAFFKGLDYLFAAQYDNGGYPQFFPLKKGYYTHITFNDDAMIGVLDLMRDIVEKKGDFLFVDEGRRARAEKAIEKGIEAILKTQVVVDGVKTVWCAQHDEVTFAPAPARAYEKVSLSGYESVGIVEFLMGVKNPDQRIVDSIESAIAWFQKTKLTGIKVIEKPVSGGFDHVVVKDSTAPALWARFYEIGTNRPIFLGRDSIVKYSLAEIEPERRNGYRWYVGEPNRLLDVEYPKWKARIKGSVASSVE